MSQRDLWNERYEEDAALFGSRPNQSVTDRLAGLEPCRVLDLGSGQGRNAIWLALQGHAVTAIDVSDVATARAAEIAAGAGVEAEFIAADLESWQPPTSEYDLVLLAYMHARESMRKSLHAKAARALRSGGRVFVVAHHSDNLEHGIGGPPVPEVLFDEAMLVADFAEFEVIEAERVTRRVERGDVKGDAIDVIFYGIKP